MYRRRECDAWPQTPPHFFHLAFLSGLTSLHKISFFLELRRSLGFLLVSFFLSWRTFEQEGHFVWRSKTWQKCHTRELRAWMNALCVNEWWRTLSFAGVSCTSRSRKLLYIYMRVRNDGHTSLSPPPPKRSMSKEALESMQLVCVSVQRRKHRETSTTMRVLMTQCNL